MDKVILLNKNGKIVLVISIIISILSAYSAIRGFVDENLYGDIIATGVFKPVYMAGTISQDMITIVSSVIMIFLVMFYVKRKSTKMFITILGLLSFYFYAYGTYVISALYTQIYFIYMIIFTLSLFGLIIGINGFNKEDINKTFLPKKMQILSIIFLSVIVVLFVPMWVSAMIPYIQSNNVPDFYAIFILDLCFVMPFFVVLIYMIFKNHKLSNILLGIALTKNITLIISVIIGELTFPTHGGIIDIGVVLIYSFIILISSLIFIFYCLKLNIVNKK